jgi:hypothetical protein
LVNAKIFGFGSNSFFFEKLKLAQRLILASSSYNFTIALVALVNNYHYFPKIIKGQLRSQRAIYLLPLHNLDTQINIIIKRKASQEKLNKHLIHYNLSPLAMELISRTVFGHYLASIYTDYTKFKSCNRRLTLTR